MSKVRIYVESREAAMHESGDVIAAGTNPATAQSLTAVPTTYRDRRALLQPEPQAGSR